MLACLAAGSRVVLLVVGASMCVRGIDLWTEHETSVVSAIRHACRLELFCNVVLVSVPICKVVEFL